MMDASVFDWTAGLAGMLMGVAVALVINYLLRQRRIQDRCEFLEVIRDDTMSAFAAAERVLESGQAPAPVREILLWAISAHANSGLGRKISHGLIHDLPRRPEPDDGETDDENAISVAMRELGAINPALERDATRAVMTLMFSLMIVHQNDKMRVEKIEMQAARDPDSIWQKLGGLLSSGDDDPHNPMGGRRAISA